MKYRLYVDEVGNPDLDSSDDPNHRFLSLTGVILDLGYVRDIVHPEMEAIKERFLLSHPDEPVVLHRKEIIHAAGAFASLRDENVRAAFDTALLDAIARWDFTMLTVCLDKKKHREAYTTWRYDPYHYCLTMMLERYAFFLRRRRAKGDVMAESRGGREDVRLKAAFERLWEQGTEYVEPAQFQEALTSRQLKVKAKTNNIAGLQLADLLAHPSRNEILAAAGQRSGDFAPFATRVVALLQDKYDRVGQRVVGKKLQ